MADRKKSAAPKKASRKKHSGGAPTKRTDARRETVLKAVRLGASLITAAKAAGLHYDTLNEWRKADAEFSAAIESARAEIEVKMLGKIEEAVDAGTWTAAAWKLERFFPERYARQRLEVTGEGGGPVKIDAELAAGAEIRANTTASKLLHEALLATVEAEA